MCCLLVFCGFRNQTVEESITLLCHGLAWPGSSLCHLVLLCPVCSSLPVFGLYPALTQLRFSASAAEAMDRPSSGDPSVPCYMLEQSRAHCVCVIKPRFVSMDPQKGAPKWSPAQGGQSSQWLEVSQGCGLNVQGRLRPDVSVSHCS